MRDRATYGIDPGGLGLHSAAASSASAGRLLLPSPSTPPLSTFPASCLDSLNDRMKEPLRVCTQFAWLCATSRRHVASSVGAGWGWQARDMSLV